MARSLLKGPFQKLAYAA